LVKRRAKLVNKIRRKKERRTEETDHKEGKGSESDQMTENGGSLEPRLNGRSKKNPGIDSGGVPSGNFLGKTRVRRAKKLRVGRERKP